MPLPFPPDSMNTRVLERHPTPIDTAPPKPTMGSVDRKELLELQRTYGHLLKTVADPNSMTDQQQLVHLQAIRSMVNGMEDE